MAGLNISEELGVILLGFSVYDSVHSAWALPLAIGGFGEGEFGPARAGLIFVFCVLIGSSLAISYRTNSIVFRDDGSSATENSLQLTRKRPILMAFSSVLAFLAIVFSIVCLGWRQGFLVWIGFMFVNFAPLVGKWTSRI